MVTSPLWTLILCVCPGARKTCVFELLLVPILDLDLSRGCAADLGTSRWRNLVADCDLERQTAKCGRDASSARCCAARLRSRSGVWSCCRPRVVVLVAADMESRCRSQPPRKSLSHCVSKDLHARSQQVNNIPKASSWSCRRDVLESQAHGSVWWVWVADATCARRVAARAL
jgi:hypothetical protein